MQTHYLEEENKKYDIGNKLYDRNIENGNKWNIVVIKDTKEVYGTNWRFIPMGTSLLEYGNAEYNWLYNEETGETIQLEEGSFTNLAYGDNLAVKDGLVFNLDPLNMEDSTSWGSAILHGFNGIEKDENGNVISGFSGTDFNFDGIDDYIEIYSESDFSASGLTIEMYGKLETEESSIGTIYKGPVEGSNKAFKYQVSNLMPICKEFNEIRFMISGTFYQGIKTGTKYQCKSAINDFHIPFKNDIYIGEPYVTFSLKEDGSFFVLLDGEKVAEDKFNDEYVKNYKEYLGNTSYPIIVGRSTKGVNPYNIKIKSYAVRVYNKALTEEEAIDNYEKTVAFRETMK